MKKLRNSKRAEKYLRMAEHLFQEQKEFQKAKLIQQVCDSTDLLIDKNKAAEDWLKEGLRLQQLGLNQAAVDAYKISISFKRDFMDAYYNMGIAYGSLEEIGVDVIDQALGCLKQTIRLSADFIHGYIALGAAYIRKEEYEKALDVLSRALTLDSKDSNAHYYIGVTYRALKDFERAATSLRSSALLKPDSLQAQYFLGLVLLDCEKFQGACDAFSETVRIKPDFAEGHYMLGYIFFEKLFDEEKGVHHLSKAEKLYIKLEDFDSLERVRKILRD
jgi:predicted Zn-dependent protease